MRMAGAALHNLLSTAALPEAARRAVLQLMATPRRHYHGLGHLAILWTRHRRFSGGTAFRAPHASRLIACAIAFHDAVYDATRRDNEHRSALLWRRHAPADLSRADIDWVFQTIEATADHLAPREVHTARDRLTVWMLDLDLTPLGEPAEQFNRNTRWLRMEYRHLPEAEWQRNRLAFLRKLQSAPALYHSAPLAAAFEQQARRNIARELAGVG